MAQCKLTPREFISNTFSPQIAAVCTSAADATCQKNNLSFVELLQPFCKLNTEGHFKDPQGNIVTVRNLRLSIQDVNAHPPESSIARKMMNEAVSSAMCERTTVIRIGTVDLDIPLSVPWFEAWREMFLSVQFPSDHEFTRHFLACMIIVSTADDNPLDKVQAMGSQLHQSIPGKLPKWFNNNALRYYILIHDALLDDKIKAESVFTEMKNIYGANNCFLLQMNSRPPGQIDDNSHLPDPWSQFLIKRTELSSGSEQNSSPRTPADTGGVSAMPNEVTTESEKSSQAGTPVVPQNNTLVSPDVADTISLSSEMSEPSNVQLEVGQEAVSVTIHPLSPESDKLHNISSTTNIKAHIASNSPINANVWADSPNYIAAQHGARLSTQDLERLRSLITEFCLKSLLPYVEKQIGLLNDVISNKKGVSRSLFSATRRLFGTNKPGAPGSAPLNAVIYTAESSELQLRRLGALEMAGLSAFMQGEMNRKTIEYMDDAILTYSNSCKMPQFATRATLLSAECLKGRGLYGEAAKQLIRMTSEDSDLRSALLLEQAAYCFIGPKMMRKYAFHAVLAGHRFSKAGQRKHSLRCYQQAYQVYNNRGWSLAEDHIHFTIGRQAASLKQVQESVKAFEKLLNANSKQPAPQQAAFLREFLHIHNLLLQEDATNDQELPVLPLPLIDSNNVKVLYGHLCESTEDSISASHVSLDDEDGQDDVRWSKMEEILITEAQGTQPMIFKPSIILYSSISNNTVKPNAVLNEPVHFSIELHNPLHISLPLSNVTLLWSFTSVNNTITNETNSETLSESELVDTQVINSIMLHPVCKQRIVLSLTPKQVGQVKVLGLKYNMSNPVHATLDPLVMNPTIFVAGKRLFEIKGPKLKNIKEKPGIQMYAVDYRLEMNVIKKAPYIQIHFSKLSSEMFCGEIQKVEVTLKNIGNAPLTNIYVTCVNAKLFSLGNEDILDEHSLKKSNKAVTKILLPSDKNNILNVGDVHKMPLWIQAPHKKGSHRLDLLFYYENVDSESIPRHRLCRHTWHLEVLDSIQIKAIASRSAVFKDTLPTLNMKMSVKNMNQIHDTITNEISILAVSCQSDTWSIFRSSVLPSNIIVHPQEMFHLLFKLQKKFDNTAIFSNVSIIEDNKSDEISEIAYPFMNFVQKRYILPLDIHENAADMQLQLQEINQKDNDPLLNTMMMNSALIVRWKNKIIENGYVVRQAIGQHHIDMKYLNQVYKYPKEMQVEQSEYCGRLKIFGPDRNIPDLSITHNKEQFLGIDLQTNATMFCKNIITFSLSHLRQGEHNFRENRLCIIPVTMYIQNHLQSKIDVRINTIGTSSDTQLPSIKTQLYSPHASTNFRYICHSAINCCIESLAQNTIKLQAILSAPGTYNLAARIEVSVKIVNNREFIPQEWNMESICIMKNAAV
ncbi:hypothetical protein HZH66_011229 [Vespula vulgaris]|uniref:Trafficking protein particle complex subunit 8 n=1 Tax=Vespula vulgaris TaxID=7454 RepID=A0A834MVD2_VESVU|nr:hypothetical protein HZH66_011229 [Vespula vulgaris]